MKSVLSHITPTELIVVDDASTDHECKENLRFCLKNHSDIHIQTLFISEKFVNCKTFNMRWN